MSWKWLAGILLIPVVGCASILSGTNDEIIVTTSPPGAKLIVVGNGRTLAMTRVSETTVVSTFPGSHVFTARTPTKLTLSKNGNWTIYVAKSGYETEAFTLDRSVDPLIWLNLLTLFTGTLIDMQTGAAWKATEPAYHINLERKP